jgi:hypothetical protein
MAVSLFYEYFMLFSFYSFYVPFLFPSFITAFCLYFLALVCLIYIVPYFSFRSYLLFKYLFNIHLFIALLCFYVYFIYLFLLHSLIPLFLYLFPFVSL